MFFHSYFSGYGDYFKDRVNQVEVYGEYGCGKSTLWVMNHTNAQILSVDTSKEWKDLVQNKANNESRVSVEWVDVGALGDWGRPLSYDKRDNFIDYALSIWKNNRKPQLVLIDGRFRVACFCYSLLNVSPGTEIFFDDYVNRSYYHIVKELLKPTFKNERMGYFVVPDEIDRSHVEVMAKQFINVLD